MVNSQGFNPDLTLIIRNWPLGFVSLSLNSTLYFCFKNNTLGAKGGQKNYDEVSFSETTNKNRKTIYRKNGNVHYKCDLH